VRVWLSRGYRKPENKLAAHAHTRAATYGRFSTFAQHVRLQQTGFQASRTLTHATWIRRILLGARKLARSRIVSGCLNRRSYTFAASRKTGPLSCPPASTCDGSAKHRVHGLEKKDYSVRGRSEPFGTGEKISPAGLASPRSLASKVGGKSAHACGGASSRPEQHQRTRAEKNSKRDH